VLFTGAKNVADPVQRVVLAPAVAVDVLLHPTSDLVDDTGGELDDVKGVQHRDRVMELVVDGVLVCVEGVEGGDLDRVPERFASLYWPECARSDGARLDR
jgi:hypothetical protein